MDDLILSELRSLIADLGKDGGLISPSVYDTAQVLRFCPPKEGVEPALNWLMSQQQPDGGWGNPDVPHARDVPTLAAILAIHTYKNGKQTNEAIQAGLAFLSMQAEYWNGYLLEDLPVGAELIIPKLIEDARALHLDVPQKQYVALLPVANRKRRYIRKINPRAATPPVFSWEAWGTEPSPELIDETGGVGHNPAATAYWLWLAAKRPDLADDSNVAHKYLARAARATGLDIPGVVPTAWPITRYEQAFSLHTLLLAGLLDHPALAMVMEPQLQDLASAIQPNGLGFSDYFMPDGDDTAAGIATLKASEHEVDLTSLKQFEEETYFTAYPDELQISHSVTARAVHARFLFNRSISHAQSFMLQRQLPDGRWLGDKWNVSWLYSTLLVTFALKLSGLEHGHALKLVVNALESTQHSDGGWGIDGKSMSIDTSYGALILYILRHDEAANSNALERAHQWLLRNYRPFSLHKKEMRWQNVQEYSAYRIDRVFELCAILVSALNENDSEGEQDKKSQVAEKAMAWI